MKALKMLSIMNQSGKYVITATYDEVDEKGNVVQSNTNAPGFYAMGDVLKNVEGLEIEVLKRLGEVAE